VLAATALLGVLGLQGGFAQASPTTPALGVDPPDRLQVAVRMTELPVPPTAPMDQQDGSCTTAINPHGTGCVKPDWGATGSPGFFQDPSFVLLGLKYAGAPATGPSSIYSRTQAVGVATDGSTPFNGDAWKCITCGVSYDPMVIDQSSFNYPPPHEFPDHRRVLVGNGILQCGAKKVLYEVTDPRCTAANTEILPIHWGSRPLASGGFLGNGREQRLSPDVVHMECNKIVFTPAGITEYPFYGRLAFDQTNQRTT
jgi:hypothetical protein